MVRTASSVTALGSLPPSRFATQLRRVPLPRVKLGKTPRSSRTIPPNADSQLVSFFKKSPLNFISLSILDMVFFRLDDSRFLSVICWESLQILDISDSPFHDRFYSFPAIQGMRTVDYALDSLTCAAMAISLFSTLVVFGPLIVRVLFLFPSPQGGLGRAPAPRFSWVILLQFRLSSSSSLPLLSWTMDSIRLFSSEIV